MTGFLLTEAQPEKVREWVDRTYAAIQIEIPELGRNPRVAAVLREAVEQHWVAFLQNFAQPDFHFRLVEAGHHLAVEVANAGMPLEVVIKIYRVAQQDVWAYVTGAVSQISPDVCSQSDALIYFWDRAGAWIDGSIDASTEVFRAATSRQTASPEVRLLAAVRDVLAGKVADPRRVSALLGGYPVSTRQTAVILGGPDPDPTLLERVAGRAAESVGASRHLLVHPGAALAWLWLPGTFDVRRLRTCIEGTAASPVHVAVGVPAEGLAGFVASYEDARATHEIALRGSMSTRGSTVLFYEDIELSALLECSSRVDRFMLRVLGPLAGEDGTMERLRETVTAFLTQGRNVEEAAAQLCVHRNTVRYRLAQVEDVLGSPIVKLGADLEVALRHHQLFHG